jgi:hypothetical protein
MRNIFTFLVLINVCFGIWSVAVPQGQGESNNILFKAYIKVTEFKSDEDL